MELVFNKIDNFYVSEFQVNSDFNLHIERDIQSVLRFYQRTADGGKWDVIQDLNNQVKNLIIDYDCSALIYPKWIKIECEVLPIYAAITTDGEITEIKTQSKEIEVTDNGITEITPDAGFAYLNKIRIKTDVAEGTSSNKLQRNDVNFFDYDGTLLYSYTWEEAKNLTELPALPNHDGIEVREWNYTLDDIKMQGGPFINMYGDLYNTSIVREIEIEGELYKGTLCEGTPSFDMEGIQILVTKDNFEKNAVCYKADNYNGEWHIDRQQDGTPYEEFIIEEMISTIGRVDVGACCYYNDELIWTKDILIIPRGEVELPVLQGFVTSTISIPNTITIAYAGMIQNSYFTNEVKIPVSIRSSGSESYSIIINCVAESFYINGAIDDTNGYYFICSKISKHQLQKSITQCNDLCCLIGNYIKFPPDFSNINFYSTVTKQSPMIFDFTECLFVPTCDGFSNWDDRDAKAIIVPDHLYHEWITTENWTNIEHKIFPKSECKNIILE